jgi:hypothetical protein
MKIVLGVLLGLMGLMAFNSPAQAQERSFLCKFTSGPRAGQIQDYTGHPAGPLPVGSSCFDGISSHGVIVSSGGGGGGEGSGSCRKPSSEDDCDKCNSDAAYERCLKKVSGD